MKINNNLSTQQALLSEMERIHAQQLRIEGIKWETMLCKCPNCTRNGE